MTSHFKPEDLSRVDAFALSDVKKGMRWRLLRWLSEVRLQHVVLAWPYGVMGACLADRGLPSVRQWFFLAMALASGRGFVAAFKHLAAPHSSGSARTSRRHRARGEEFDLWVTSLLLLSMGSLFFVSFGFLNREALVLSPIVLVCLLAGWYVRGRHWLAHFGWGISLGIVPVGAWVGIRGSLDYAADWPVLALGAGVALWAAGLDMVFSCETVERDRAARAFTAAVQWGKAIALLMARVCHGLAAVVLALLILYEPMGRVYLYGCVAFAALLVYQHSLVRLDDSRKAALQFFNINCFVTLVLVATAVLDVLI